MQNAEKNEATNSELMEHYAHINCEDFPTNDLILKHKHEMVKWRNLALRFRGEIRRRRQQYRQRKNNRKRSEKERQSQEAALKAAVEEAVLEELSQKIQDDMNMSLTEEEEAILFPPRSATPPPEQREVSRSPPACRRGCNTQLPVAYPIGSSPPSATSSPTKLPSIQVHRHQDGHKVNINGHVYFTAPPSSPPNTPPEPADPILPSYSPSQWGCVSEAEERDTTPNPLNQNIEPNTSTTEDSDSDPFEIGPEEAAAQERVRAAAAAALLELNRQNSSNEAPEVEQPIFNWFTLNPVWSAEQQQWTVTCSNCDHCTTIPYSNE